MKRDGSSRHRGSTYIIVLGSTLVISVIGLSAVMAVRIERRSTEGNSDLIAARTYARSAIELGFLSIQTDGNWRDMYSSGAWMSDKPIGTGSYTLLGIDPDGDLANSNMDPLVLTGIGMEGEARYRLQVSLTARITPLSCLETAVHAGTGVVFGRATVTCNQIISSNAGISASLSSVTADVEAADTISGATYIGTQTSGAAARTMPDTTANDFYKNNGTPIAIGQIPLVGTIPTIENVVLSSTSNPYGPTTNALGIYVINCGGQKIRIRNTRIVATLVLINPASDSEVVGSVNWRPFVANYPALMVEGSIVLAMSNAVLSEATLGVNFNPGGTPSAGVVDADQIDVYRSTIEGLVYASASVTVYNATTIDGGLIAGGTVMSQAPSGTSSPSFGYKAVYYNNPPPGFTDAPKMVATPGSWKRVVN